MAHAVCILAGQLGISKALASDLHHYEREAVCIGKFVILRRPIVEAKHLFIHILPKVKRLDGNVSPFETARLPILSAFSAEGVGTTKARTTKDQPLLTVHCPLFTDH